MTEQHLTDERMSAHLDEVDEIGRAIETWTDEVEQHLVSCASCRRRFEALGSASRLVAMPVDSVSPGTRAHVVAQAIRSGLGDSPLASTEPDLGSATRKEAVPLELLAEGPRDRQDLEVAAARRMPTPWYRRKQVLVGVAAAVVVLGVALPVVLSSQSSPTSTAARSGSSPPQKDSGVAGTANPQGAGYGPGAGSSSPSPGATPDQAPLYNSSALPDLGRVSSVDQVVARLGQAGDSVSSAGSTRTAFGTEVARFSSCVISTRSEVIGGQYGPGLVATATYQGRAALVMEFWPTASTPAVGKSMVAVSSASTCQLLARKST